MRHEPKDFFLGGGGVGEGQLIPGKLRYVLVPMSLNQYCMDNICNP